MDCVPVLIIGSMVKVCPGFMTPTALFSGVQRGNRGCGWVGVHGNMQKQRGVSGRLTAVVWNIWDSVEKPERERERGGDCIIGKHAHTHVQTHKDRLTG